MPSIRIPASPFDGLGLRDAGALRPKAKYGYRRAPLALRRELLDCITRLERALEIAQLPQTWFDALQQYRGHRRLPVRLSAAQFVAVHGVRGELPLGVRTYARDLDSAFQRIHSYDPREHLTKGVISIVHSRKRSESDGAEHVRKLFEGERDWPPSPTRKRQLFERAKAIAPRSTVYSVFKSVSGERLAGPLAQVEDGLHMRHQNAP